MKWKKFLYKQLCEREEILVCKAPSCAVCCDHGESASGPKRRRRPESASPQRLRETASCERATRSRARSRPVPRPRGASRPRRRRPAPPRRGRAATGHRPALAAATSRGVTMPTKPTSLPGPPRPETTGSTASI
ncbi:MAG: nitrogen fixation protein NifQ [Comamonadaceae bacterium]|nr:nitrogen fixation protein NifQ [Comamonadaceae bacterium]